MSFSGAFRRDCFEIPLIPAWAKLSIMLATALFCSLFGPPPQAHAQAIIVTVNGDPITDLDIAQRMKLLRVLREPATREAAIESLVDDRLMLDETKRYQISLSDTEIGQEIARTANAMKVAPQALFAEIQQAGVSESHYKDHFSAVLAFDLLVEAFHKGVEPSEAQISAELAKEGGKAASTEYKINQVIFVVPATAITPAAIRGRVEAAQQLRARFADCASGLPLARAMDNVAVKEELVRNSSQLNGPLKELLDKTPVGHLTAPQRTQDGIEMIAVCGKGASSDNSAIRQQISQRLLLATIEEDAARRLKEMRAHAIVVKK